VVHKEQKCGMYLTLQSCARIEVKVGDLVKKRDRFDYSKDAGLGLIIRVAGHDLIQVQWADDYGTFWTTENHVELISESGRPCEI